MRRRDYSRSFQRIILILLEFLIFYSIFAILSNELAALSIASITFLILLPMNFKIQGKGFFKNYLKVLSSASMGFSLAFLLLISTFFLLTISSYSFLNFFIFLIASIFSLFLIFLFIKSIEFKGGMEPRIKQAWSKFLSEPWKFMKSFLIFAFLVSISINLLILSNEFLRTIGFCLLLESSQYPIFS